LASASTPGIPIYCTIDTSNLKISLVNWDTISNSVSIYLIFTTPTVMAGAYNFIFKVYYNSDAQSFGQEFIKGTLTSSFAYTPDTLDTSDSYSTEVPSLN